MTEKMFMKVIYPSYNISWGHIAQNFWKTRLLFPPPPQRQHVLIRSEGFHKHWWSPWVEKVSVKHLFPRSKMSLCADTNTVKSNVLSPVNHKSYTGDCLELYHRNCPSWAHWGRVQPAEKKQSLDLDLPDMFVRSKIITSKPRWCWLSVPLPTTCRRVNGT